MEKIIDVIVVITVMLCVIIITVHTPNEIMGWIIGFISGVLLMLLTE